MEYSRIGSRGHLFTWMKPYHTNVYVIDGFRHVFVVDTFLGPSPMDEVKAKLVEAGVRGKPYVVFNTTQTMTTSGGIRSSGTPL